MSRNNYDDMPTRYERSHRQGRKTGLVAFLGVLITLVGIVLFLIMSPTEENVVDAEKAINDAVSIIAPAPVVEQIPEVAVLETVPEVEETSVPAVKPVLNIILEDTVPIEIVFEEEPAIIPELEENVVEEEPIAEVEEEPVVEVAEEPIIEVAEEEVPVVEELAIEEVIIEEPTLEEEIVEPIAEEPVVEEPVVEEPAVEEPAVEEPAVEEPAVEEPIVEVIIEEEPILAEPEPVEEAISVVEEVVVPAVAIPISPFPIDNNILTMVTYTVLDSDNLYSIAEAFNVEAATIVSVNSLSNVDSFLSGDILFIPNMDGKVYVVKSGDDVNAIYNRFNPGCTEEEFIKMNLLEDRALETGMKVFLPKSTISSAVENEQFFSIPFDGEITVLFGETYNSRVLDGVIVKGYSTKVVAPLNGVVEKAGRNNSDGKYVIIAHEGGYKTGYYGLETVDVRKGMQINEGDVIGSINANGIFGKFSILFKVEQNGIALDPESFL